MPVRAWWQVLGVARDADRTTIRRAYAKRLKVTNPEDDPQGFMALREAYEAALRWSDFAVVHDDDDDDDDDEEEARAAPDGPDAVPDGDPVAVTPVAPQVIPHVAQARPADPAPASAADDPAMADATHSDVDWQPEAAAHDAERADLRALTDALEAGLRGPWFADADRLRFTLARMLDAPAMIELETRDRIEHWLAGLLADTIPRSDVLLVPAIEAFGWEAEGNRPHAVWDILSRLDEWRLIGDFDRGEHRLSPAWRALTRGTGTRWPRRLTALRPGFQAKMRELLDLVDYQLPGLAHSIDASARDWWRAFVERPRFAFTDAIVIFLCAWFAISAALSDAPSGLRLAILTASVLVATGFPLVRLHLIAPWRSRRQERGALPDWRSHGWIALWLASAMVFIFAPDRMAVMVAVAAAGAIAALWMLVAAASAPRLGNWMWRAFSYGALLALGGSALEAASPSHQIALAGVALASLAITVWGGPALVAAGWRLGRWPVAIATGTALAFVAAGLVRVAMSASPFPMAQSVGAGLVATVLLGAVRDVADGSVFVRFVPALRFGIWFVLVIAIIAGAPDRRRQDGPPPVQTVSADAMKSMEAVQPGYRALRTGNPTLYASIRDIAAQIASGSRTRDDGARAIDRLVNIAYRERLPEASAALIAAEFEIQLATRRELRSRDPRACADGLREGQKHDLSAQLERRHYAHALAVAASMPASVADRAAGTPASLADLLRDAANGKPDREQALSRALQGSDAAAKCAARIAVLEALVARPDADIAKTMRPALVTQAAEDSAKAKGRQAP
ncbi:J domain-containing protein [Sphingomonas sp.]|uniref:J domain-containing protein n=1 Tax=Sphingomonas sp. TaxID=28214 RepID=UPI001ED6D619|nr:J domain-containing protein [Sphingomonas sp.]MBX3594974.1 hypothetical protein [Sphingomonas sp.]